MASPGEYRPWLISILWAAELRMQCTDDETDDGTCGTCDKKYPVLLGDWRRNHSFFRMIESNENRPEVTAVVSGESIVAHEEKVVWRDCQ